MAMAATLASPIMYRWETRRTVPVVVSTQKRFVNPCINGRHVRRLAAAAGKEYSIHDLLQNPPFWKKKLSHPTGKHNLDLAVDKAIQHSHNHIKMSDEVDPVRATSHCISGVEMFHVLLKTRGGQKYVAIYVAPMISDDSMKLDDEALKLVFFGKVDYNVSLPLRRVVGKIKWPVSPRNDPLIMAAARFALARYNKEEKLARLIRATSQMVGEHEILRVTFKVEFWGGSTNYDAIVLVPRNNPEKMELVKFGISDGWGMYRPFFNPVRRYCYVDEDEYESESEVDEDEDENDPRVTAAARFALAQHNEEDRVLRVVEATRRTYSGDEILSMRFDGELDGSMFYEAIILVPVNDPENMRLAYVGRNGDEYDPNDPDDHFVDVGKERFSEFQGGFEECSIDDPHVIEAAQLALTQYNKKEKLLRVVKAASRYDSDYKSYKVTFVGEYHPLRTYEAILRGHIKYPCPKKMWVKYVFPELSSPTKRPHKKQESISKGVAWSL